MENKKKSEKTQIEGKQQKKNKQTNEHTFNHNTK